MDKFKALRAQAEEDFNTLQNSLNLIKTELQKFGLETMEDGYAELNRLQGEFRALNKVMEESKQDDNALKVDATSVDPPKDKK